MEGRDHSVIYTYHSRREEIKGFYEVSIDKKNYSLQSRGHIVIDTGTCLSQSVYLGMKVLIMIL